ncbi:restriction endonuclease [Saccharicrinis sp. FJH62]|uniref:restriction endonuclease n=1 Tax=Saccharicrinis sp. FJH62 TaxID=3344657 RepID=UPI0035D4EDDC
MKPRNISIKKASGEEEFFHVEKLKKSLHNAGASDATIENIAKEISDYIFPGITTKQIYQRAFSLLKRERSAASVRYKLKKAIFELGPSGYPFEDLIGQIFARQGYETEVGIVVDGRCITHEMDVIATKDGMQHLMECKYHKDQGKQVSIQVPLYVRSRVDDIIKKRETLQAYSGLTFQGWVVTNTRFSSDSIQYSKCSGLNLLAWDYPYGNSLKELIERLKIYPVTILHSLTLKEKQLLLEKDIVTCEQLNHQIDILSELNLTRAKYRLVLKELTDLGF